MTIEDYFEFYLPFSRTLYSQLNEEVAMISEFYRTFIPDSERAPQKTRVGDYIKKPITEKPEKFSYCAVESNDTWPSGKPKCAKWASVDRDRVCVLVDHKLTK